MPNFRGSGLVWKFTLRCLLLGSAEVINEKLVTNLHFFCILKGLMVSLYDELFMDFTKCLTVSMMSRLRSNYSVYNNILVLGFSMSLL